MAAPATSVVFLEAEVKKPASHPLRVRQVASGMQEDDEEQKMCRRLFERFMRFVASLYEAPNVYTQPCVLYTMRVSVKKAQASWSHRSSRRFFPERRGSFPIPIFRVAGPDDQVEQVVDRSGAPGEPYRPGIVSGIFEKAYDVLELPREKGVIHKAGSPAPWREVAVIRGMRGGRGITVTSHVRRLVVRLHEMLFLLSGPSATVDLRFSEQWFHLPATWTEERLYAEDGFQFIDIASPVENLVKKLYEMRKQEEQEMERRRWETEEEREKRLLEEELTLKREEEERKRIYERKEEERRRRVEEEAAKPRERSFLLWDAALWLINEAQPVAVRCYSKFKLSMNSNKQVSCKCIEQEGLRDMLQRVEDGEYVLPISKIEPTLASSRALETLGFVEAYSDLETSGFGHERCRFLNRSGLPLSSVVMVSRSAAKVLTIKILVLKLGILLDDGMVMSGHYGSSVDIHCDDISSSELLTTDWAYHILCKNIDGEGRTSFSTLLVHLKKKLQLQLTKEESALFSMSAIDGMEENEDLVQLRRKQQEWVPAKPKHELEEVELHDCSLLFPTPLESEA